MDDTIINDDARDPLRLDGIEFVYVPGATYWMGCNHAAANQSPAHRVRVAAFFMMRCPVSRAEYTRFLVATGHPAPALWDEPRFADAQQPAVGCNWYDAKAFAGWLADFGDTPVSPQPEFAGIPVSPQWVLRLPTEAEREWAATGGALFTVYPWGNAPLDTPLGPIGDGPLLLGTTPPNGFGLHHMCDGVHEWCEDWYDANAYTRAGFEPVGPSGGTRKVARGGSWRHRTRVTATRARSSLPPDHRYADFGFRLVLAERVNESRAPALRDFFRAR